MSWILRRRSCGLLESVNAVLGKCIIRADLSLPELEIILLLSAHKPQRVTSTHAVQGIGHHHQALIFTAPRFDGPVW